MGGYTGGSGPQGQGQLGQIGGVAMGGYAGGPGGQGQIGGAGMGGYVGPGPQGQVEGYWGGGWGLEDRHVGQWGGWQGEPGWGRQAGGWQGYEIGAWDREEDRGEDRFSNWKRHAAEKEAEAEKEKVVRGKGIDVEEGNRRLEELIREREEIEGKIRQMREEKK